jgi:hypothetical protein
MILPTQIDLITPALVADADGEAHAAVRILWFVVAARIMWAR